MSEFKGIHQDRLKVGFSRPEGKISRRELFKLASPFGKVALDDSKCTGCGLCALDCPTEALFASSSEENGYQLLFRHDRCVACGRCVEICPEKCLHLERTLELDRLNSPATVLFEDRIVRCRECGDVIGSRAMIDRLQARLPAKEAPLAAQFELCPVCKIRAQFNPGRPTLEPTTKPD